MSAKVYPLHIMDDRREFERKVAHCDQEAGWYFAQATKGPKAEFDATMNSLLGVTGPKWDRARDAAKAKFRESTADARVLCDLTFDCLMETGEVSSELDDLWTALIDGTSTLERVAVAMAAE